MQAFVTLSAFYNAYIKKFDDVAFPCIIKRELGDRMDGRGNT